VEQFLEIPLSQRVRHILNHEAAFFRGQIPVKASEALASLRSAMARKSEA
jgi:hypothetical protein